MENMGIYIKLQKIRAEINKDFIEPDNGHCTYGFFNLWWLDCILMLMGKFSHRDKMEFLESLQYEKKLAEFYHLLGINPKPNSLPLGVPALGTWTDYKSHIVSLDNLEKCSFDLIPPSLLERLQNAFHKNEKILGVPLSIDGKQIIHSQHEGHCPIHTIQFVIEKTLVYADFTYNENSWIKNKLEIGLETVFARFPEVLFCATGDSIYNNSNTRKMFDDLGCQYFLPVKCPSEGYTLKSKIMEKSGIAESQQKAFYYEPEVQFRNQCKVVDIVKLIPIQMEHITCCLQIHRVWSSTVPDKDGKYKKEISDLLYISNTTEPMSKSLLRDLYRMKQQHWQVETYHQTKDVRLEEDRNRKAPLTACINARKLDFLIQLIKTLYGGCKKKNFRQFAYDLTAELFAGAIFLVSCFFVFFRSFSSHIRSLRFVIRRQRVFCLFFIEHY